MTLRSTRFRSVRALPMAFPPHAAKVPEVKGVPGRKTCVEFTANGIRLAGPVCRLADGK